MLDIKRHPCFNVAVKGWCGRMHLPVAPRCNIMCNYCNRKYDCVNESRPGVTSTVLTPPQAEDYVRQVLQAEPRITVAGIAGPGDPFANPRETLETLRRIRRQFPDLLLCLATNGLGLPPFLDELADIGVSHVSVTVNAVDPEIGRQIYSWVRDGKVIYRGLAGAKLLLSRQMAVLEGLKARNLVVKVNTIVIPGINEAHVVEVAKAMADRGVDILNCMPLYPNADTPFADIPEPTSARMAAIQAEAGKYLPQMRHCTRCRADAVGLLDQDRTAELRPCLSASADKAPDLSGRPYVAVGTLEGVLVNQHLGEAGRFQIWGPDGQGFHLIAERPAPPPGGGLQRWQALAETLQDCRAVLVSAIGDTPREVLRQQGIMPVVMQGFIDQGLQVVYRGGDPSSLKNRRRGVGGGCSGSTLNPGGGCM
ncbi:MAG TPA: nitrogenase cofactor biosynthesis protein NifB [Desulfobacterales bacterium]|nr:nitrogenase cofactor biosynthesis protein NifB [Desulfobacterales bacterium]